MNGPHSYAGAPNYVGVVLFPPTVAATAGTAFGSILGAPPNTISLGEFQTAAFLLNVTAAAAAVGDTLDVFVQTTFDAAPTAASTWIDVVHFGQVLGNGGAVSFVDKLVSNLAQAEFGGAAALAVSTVRHIFGDAWRVKFTVVDGGAHGQSFTFAVTANFK